MPNPRDEPSTALALFSVHAGPRIGEEIAVRSPVLTIGQGSQNDVVLADDSVSTTHARLEYSMGAWRLTDLGSTNGTYVEGVRLAPEVPTPLDYGSLVRFGGLSLHFRESERADPEAARASYTPPPPRATVAERPRGFRLPVWILLVLLLIAIVVYFVIFAPDAAALAETGDALRLALAPLPPGMP